MLCPAVLFELYRKTQELLLSLVLEHYRPAPEKDRGLDLGTFLKELPCMGELELEVVLIGVGTETDLLDNNLGSIGLHLLRLLLLLIDVLLVVKDLAYGGIRLSADLHQIKPLFISHRLCCRELIDTGILDVVSYKADLGCPDFIIDPRSLIPASVGIGPGAVVAG